MNFHSENDILRLSIGNPQQSVDIYVIPIKILGLRKMSADPITPLQP